MLKHIKKVLFIGVFFSLFAIDVYGQTINLMSRNNTVISMKHQLLNYMTGVDSLDKDLINHKRPIDILIENPWGWQYKFVVINDDNLVPDKYMWNIDGKAKITDDGILSYHFDHQGNHIVEVTKYVKYTNVGKISKKIIVKSQFDEGLYVDALSLASVYDAGDFIYKLPKGYSPVFSPATTRPIYYEYMHEKSHKYTTIYLLTAKYRDYSFINSRDVLSIQAFWVSDINIKNPPIVHSIGFGEDVFVDQKYNSSDVLPGYQVDGKWLHRVNRDTYTIHYLCIDNTTDGWWRKIQH